MYDISGNKKNIAYSLRGCDHLDFDVVSDAIGGASVGSLVPCSADFGTLQYVGGICVNDKIYCTPNCADDILVYKISDGSTYKIGAGLGTNKFKYTGQILYRGKIYMLHRGTNHMIEVNPKTDAVRLIDLHLGYTVNPYDDYRDSYHYNGAISDQGYLYQPPAYNNTDLLKINMQTFEVEKIHNFTCPAGTWIGAVRHPKENKIIFLSTTTWRIWDCDTDTYEDVSHDKIACYDMVYDPRYNCLIGAYPNHFVALMLDTKQIINSDYRNHIDTGYGISVGLDGKYWHLEGKNAYYAIFDGTAFTTGAMQFVAGTGDFGDATPYIAGNVIDTDGCIYGIPASGTMSKLSFTGGSLPAEVVSSQYYGKY